MRRRTYTKRRGSAGRKRRMPPRMKTRKSARIPGSAMKVGYRL